MLPGFEPRPQTLEFFIPGKARGKDFVGFNIGTRVMVTADRDSQKYMREIEDAANTARNIFGEWIIPDPGVPVQVWIVEKIAIRESWSASKRAQLLGKDCTVKPDNDNVENCVFDALTGHLPPKKKAADMSPGERQVNARRKRIGGLLSDDAQISFNQTRKIWSLPEEAGLYVTLRTGSYVDPKDELLRRAQAWLPGDDSAEAMDLVEQIEEALNG